MEPKDLSIQIPENKLKPITVGNGKALNESASGHSEGPLTSLLQQGAAGQLSASQKSGSAGGVKLERDIRAISRQGRDDDKQQLGDGGGSFSLPKAESDRPTPDRMGAADATNETDDDFLNSGGEAGRGERRWAGAGAGRRPAKGWFRFSSASSSPPRRIRGGVEADEERERERPGAVVGPVHAIQARGMTDGRRGG